ncbi:MAG: amidohydrolase [Clostridiales bacterium]|nr:amidohydrolase [Clostridiales bacterium]
MLFNNVKILDEDFNLRDNMYVATEDDRIVYVGDSMPRGDYGDIRDGKGKLLMPAFHNAHGHSPMALLRGYAENMTLQDWLFNKVFPFEDKLNSNAVYWGTLLTMAEGMRFGIVSHSDMYYFLDDMVRATDDSGCKANISRAITEFGDGDPWETVRLKEMKDTYERLNGAADGRVKIDISIHAEYTNSLRAMQAVADYCNQVGSIMHIHVSETQSEHEECKKKYGKTPVRLFNDIGAFDSPALAAHCVWIEGEDFDILKEKGVSVASNPISNMKLASGVANVPEMLRRGINVAIGTDSVASNNSLNFFEEMKIFAMASKMYYHDPTAVTPREALYAATRAGAIAQGRLDSGLIKEGFKADLIMVDINQPNMFPVHDLLNNLVYSASGTDVVMTMSDGKVVYENGEYKFIDIEKTIFEAQAATKDILARL